MHVSETTADAQAFVRDSKKRRVLVPTMGALHDGHVGLMRLARKAAGAEGEVAVSIFVNALQFEPGADYERYPRPQEADEDLCRRAGVDLLFRPSPAEMYYENRSVTVDENSLSETLCGRSRPGHFRGVCTVVSKLFHLLAPHAAVFGEKDFQQLAVIRRMVRDLNFAVEIIAAPIVREVDGLALSSRNRYLTPEQREQAPIIHAVLLEAAELVKSGILSVPVVLQAARKRLATAWLARVDYLEIVDAETLQPQAMVDDHSLIVAAVFFRKTRLIDNLRLR